MVSERTRGTSDRDPGWSLATRVERRIMAIPARLRQRGLRRDFHRFCERAPLGDPARHAAPALLRRHGTSPEALACWVREARALGQGEDVLLGALAITRGMALQCADGDLQVSSVAAACKLLVLGGQRVHVALPDGAGLLMEAVVQELTGQGLRHAVLSANMNNRQRRIAHAAPVLVGSAPELLRDHLAARLADPSQQGDIRRRLGRLLQGAGDREPLATGPPFGIVLGARQVMIDQANEPVSLLSASDAAHERRWAHQALRLADSLQPETDYRVTGQAVTLTGAGSRQLECGAQELSGAWRNAARRNADVTLALTAMLLRNGIDYRCCGQQIEISRAVAARPGLLQLLQAREGVTVTGRPQVRARLSLQRYFRRYAKLAAVDADMQDIGQELWMIYGLAPFLLSAAPDRPPEPIQLSEGDERLLAAVRGRSARGAELLEPVLQQWRRHRQRALKRRLRADLLQLDNQSDTLTAFTGKFE